MPPIPHNQQDIWAPHLKSDEKVLWQQQPDPRVQMVRGSLGGIIIGAVFMIVGALGVLISLAATHKAGGVGPYFLALFFSVFFLAGFHASVLQFFIAAARRRNTYYAVTGKRLLTLVIGKKTKLEAEPLHADIYLDYLPGDLASIFFKKIAKRSSNSNNSKTGKRTRTYSTTYTYKGFELIEDGAGAYQAILSAIGAKLANPENVAQRRGAAWDDFLYEGETLLWTGQPVQGPRPTRAGLISTGIGLYILYLIGPYFFHTLLRTMSNPSNILSMIFPLILVLLGLWLAVGIWIYDIKKRKNTQYALTNKRAFVAKNLFKRSLVTHALKVGYRPLLIENAFHDVTFGEEDAFSREGKAIKRAIAFKTMSDGSEVYRILTDLSIKLDASASE